MTARAPISRKLAQRHKEQRGLCYWCGRKAYLRDGLSNVELAEMTGVKVGSHRWRAKARRREATVEHLVPKSKGGTDAWDNLVMACKQCNTVRGNDVNWTPSAKVEAPEIRVGTNPLPDNHS